jgi:hypothetical protein
MRQAGQVSLMEWTCSVDNPLAGHKEGASVIQRADKEQEM